MLDLFARQGLELWVGVFIVGAVFAALLIPYLWEEISRGKAELGPSIPTGAGDTHPGYVGNPAPDQPDRPAGPHDAEATLSLRAFHIVLVWLSVVLAAATGVWGLLNQQVGLGVLSLGFGLLLVAYGGYFASKAEKVHLE